MEKEVKSERSKACQNMFHSRGRALRALLHGDDFLTVGPKKETHKLEKEMDERYEAKHEEIGPGQMNNNMKVLDIEIIWHEDRLTIEADRQHVKAALKDLGLEDTKVMKTPGVKDTRKTQQETEKHKADVDCDEEAVTRKRRIPSCIDGRKTSEDWLKKLLQQDKTPRKRV